MYDSTERDVRYRIDIDTPMFIYCALRRVHSSSSQAVDASTSLFRSSRPLRTKPYPFIAIPFSNNKHPVPLLLPKTVLYRNGWNRHRQCWRYRRPGHWVDVVPIIPGSNNFHNLKHDSRNSLAIALSLRCHPLKRFSETTEQPVQSPKSGY